MDAHREKSEKHLSILNHSSLQQHRLSLQCSNVTSDVLLNDVWQKNTDLLDDAVNVILSTAQALMNGADTGNKQHWKSSLCSFTDPKVLCEKSIPPCTQCNTLYNLSNVDNFYSNKCKCDLPITKTVESSSTEVNLPSNKSIRNLGSSQESGSGDYRLFKPKFGHKRLVKQKQFGTINDNEDSKTNNIQRSTLNRQNLNSAPKPIRSSFNNDAELHDEIRPRSNQKHNTMTRIDTEQFEAPIHDIDKIEEDNKAHKSNVAKITFKTAKEQLLASNPAAKRTLGASRKAQGKFVSPMIGAQEKQENSEPACTDERLKNIDPKMIELIENEIIDKGTPVGWDDIAGLHLAKSVIQEAVVWPLLRPDIFTGLRRPPKGILLFGPPGTGKTLIGKCVAAQCRATFFSISASSLTSKWIGDGEKMVRALFAVARIHQPAVIFIDEIDSLLSQRSDTEHEATRRIKTEFLVQFDGAATGDEDRLLIVGATNRPHELDEAARRRLVKRLYIPLPEQQARHQIISNLLCTENNSLTSQQMEEIAGLTEGYSGADMKSLCSEAAMGPIRAVPLSQIVTIDREQVRPVNVEDFRLALQRVRPSVSQDDLGQYVKWNNTYGQGF